MRCRTNASKPSTSVLAGILLSLSLLLTACLPDAGSTENGRDRFSEIPTFPVDVNADVTPTPQQEDQVPIPEFISALLAPGPTLEGTERAFFRNGRDFWSITTGEEPDVSEALPQGTRFGAYATSPHGQRAAIVAISNVDDQPVETVHIVANGQIGPPVTPQRFTAGPDAQSAIHALVWSRDATRIAIVYDEPMVEILEIARADGGPPQIVQQLALPADYRGIERIDWATTSSGMAILAKSQSGAGSLWIASPEGDLFEVPSATLDGRRSIADIAWLPGRGRIAFVEERGSTPLAGGSLFSIAPDGTGRELLVSSGNFAPAAEIINISASPGGTYIALTVYVPGADGDETFHSAWIANIDSGEITKIPVSTGFRITDFWWMVDGLLWRAVHRSADVPGPLTEYAGFEPFLMGLFNPDDGASRVLFQSDAD